MGRAMNEVESKPQDVVAGSAAFEKLRELTRNGYVSLPEDRHSDGSVLLRHDTAPDLLLRPDGAIEVPLGQPAKPRMKPRWPLSFWQTAFVLVVGIAGTWFLTLFAATVLLDFFGRP